MPLLVKAASSVESMRFLRKRSSHCRRNHGKILGVGKNQMVRMQQLFMTNQPNSRVRATCSLLVFGEFSSKHLGMSTSPSSAVYCTRSDSTDPHDVMINEVKRSWVRKPMSRTSLRTCQSSCTITTDLIKNYVHTRICVFSECVAIHFEHIQSKHDTQTTALHCM
jgi:hypothetical protein